LRSEIFLFPKAFFGFFLLAQVFFFPCKPAGLRGIVKRCASQCLRKGYVCEAGFFFFPRLFLFGEKEKGLGKGGGI